MMTIFSLFLYLEWSIKMKTDAIREKKNVRKLINYFKKQDNYRNLILFCFGIYTGLRSKDILKIKVSQVKDKDKIAIKESKTNKYKHIQLHPELMEYISVYCKGRKGNEYLFKSNWRKDINEPISYVQAYRILKQAAKDCRIRGNIAMHSLRKTNAIHLYDDPSVDSTVVQYALNHGSLRETLIYLGVAQEEVNEATQRLFF